MHVDIGFGQEQTTIWQEKPNNESKCFHHKHKHKAQQNSQIHCIHTSLSVSHYKTMHHSSDAYFQPKQEWMQIMFTQEKGKNPSQSLLSYTSSHKQL